MATETDSRNTQQSGERSKNAQSAASGQSSEQGRSAQGQEGAQAKQGTQGQQGTQGGSQGQGMQGSQQGGAIQRAEQGGMQRRGQGASGYGRNPLAVMEQLSQEVDQLLESFFYGTPTRGQAQAQTVWVPQIDVRQKGNQLRVSVDLPGVDQACVNLALEEGMLTISGEREEERAEGDEQQGFRRIERRYGSFYRAIPLPEEADVEKAQAEMKNGVLEITIPLAQRKQSRRLEIKS